MKTQTQKQLAGFLGISPQYLSDIKNNRRSLGKGAAIRISVKTGLPIQDILLLGGEDFLRRAMVAMLVNEQGEAK